MSTLTDVQTNVFDALSTDKADLNKIIKAVGGKYLNFDYHFTDATGELPLHKAARESNETLIRLFMLNGTEPNINGGEHGHTPFWLLIMGLCSRIKCIFTLVEAGGKPYADEIKTFKSYMSDYKAMIEQMESIEVPSQMPKAPPVLGDSDAQTNVFECFKTDTSLLNVQKAVGPDYMTFDYDFYDVLGELPLHKAARESNEALMQLFLSEGVDPNAISGQHGFTPLWLLLIGLRSHMKCIITLVEAGGAPLAANIDAFKSHISLCKSMLQQLESVKVSDMPKPAPAWGIWAIRE